MLSAMGFFVGRVDTEPEDPEIHSPESGGVEPRLGNSFRTRTRSHLVKYIDE